MRVGVAVSWLAVLVATVSAGCSSGSTGSPAASCSGAPPSQGTGWNLGRPPIDPDAAARAEVAIASCLPDDKPNSRLKYLYFDRNEGSPLEMDWVACVAGKTNGCQGVTECTGATVTIGGACSEGCHGDVLEACDPPMKQLVDCSKFDARCVAGQGCVPCDGAATCSVMSYPGSCNDGRPMTCHHRLETTGLRCADLGLACQADPDAYPDEPAFYGCYGTGVACTTSSSGPGQLEGTACNGSTLAACVAGFAFDIDCAQIGAGFSCQSYSGANGEQFYCGLGAECDGSNSMSPEPTCDGNSVVICNAGLIQKIDCTALGFSGCSPQWGRCVPGPYS